MININFSQFQSNLGKGLHLLEERSWNRPLQAHHQPFGCPLSLLSSSPAMGNSLSKIFLTILLKWVLFLIKTSKNNIVGQDPPLNTLQISIDKLFFIRLIRCYMGSCRKDGPTRTTDNRFHSWTKTCLCIKFHRNFSEICDLQVKYKKKR